MIFYNATERTEYDLNERDFIDEMLNGDVWQYQEEDSQSLTNFFSKIVEIYETDFKDFIADSRNITGVIAGDSFTVYANEFWLVEDLKTVLVEELNFLDNY